MDPAKMKVVELREELQARGLNTKGVKADLVKRLKEALEKETKTTIPDTSILDTTTEEMDTSQNEEGEDSSAAEDSSKKPKEKTVPSPAKATPQKSSPQKSSPQKSAPEKSAPEKSAPKEDKPKEDPKKKQAEENGTDESEQDGDDDDDEENQENAEEKADAEGESEKTEGEGETKGGKRKREGEGENERASKKRGKSPIREDEPEIDVSKTLLSWFDSDLLLKLDRSNFLNAVPINEGAMGYIWNGIRATHGISSGKICYEVKLKEALKWSDLTKQFTIPERSDRYSKRKDNTKKKNESKEKTENKEKKEGDKDEKMETDEKTESEEKTENGDDKKEEAKTETKVKEAKKDENEQKKKSKEEKESKEETEGKEEKESKDEKEGEGKTEESDEKEEPKKEEPPKEPIPTHLFRVGFSLGGTSLQLGENKFSYGYESSGKFVSDKTFTPYAITFGEGDVVGAFLSIDNSKVTITYTVNGAVQPVATTFPRSELPENFVLYPHVSSRNFAFELNFGDNEETWFPIPAELKGYQFLSKFENKTAGPMRPETRKDCEVYLMIGLPASGKTHWVNEHIKEHPEKQYTVIGNHSLQEKMTVDGESIRQRFAGSWKILNDKLQKTLNKLTDIAALRRRHFIIDQTNLFQAAQRRKMRSFDGYQRKAVVVVPTVEEQERRLKQQVEQDGKSIPEQTIWELKAGMELPEKADWLEEILWPELDEEKAKEIVKKYNEDAKAKGYTKRFPRRHGPRFGGNRDRYDRWGGNQRQEGWGSWGRQGGGWDRRDRGPPRQGGWGGDYSSRNARQGSGGSAYSSGNRRQGSGGGGWGGQQGSWGGGRQGGGGGWNQQMYSGYQKYNQEGWGGYGQGWGQGWGSQGGAQGGQGGGNRQNWNYYGQYGQGSWQQQY